MLEARLSPTLLLKKIIEALKEIIAQGTLDCSDSGLQVCLKSDKYHSVTGDSHKSHRTIAK